MPEGWLSPLATQGAAGGDVGLISRTVLSQQLIQHGGQILDLLSQHMCDAVRTLHPSRHAQHPSGDDRAAETFVNVTPDDDVYNAGFVLKCQKDNALCCSGALT